MFSVMSKKRSTRAISSSGIDFFRIFINFEYNIMLFVLLLTFDKMIFGL